jgi:hypothetical protein
VALGEADVEGDADNVGANVGTTATVGIVVGAPVDSAVAEAPVGSPLGTELGESDAKIVSSTTAPDGVPPVVVGDAAGAPPGAALGLVESTDPSPEVVVGELTEGVVGPLPVGVEESTVGKSLLGNVGEPTGEEGDPTGMGLVGDVTPVGVGGSIGISAGKPFGDEGD